MYKWRNQCIWLALVLALCIIFFAPKIFAQPFGKGKFGENVPFGSATSLSIASDGDVMLQLTPTPSGSSSTVTSTILVTSTDVVGYKLYIRSLGSTDMTNGTAIVATSANSVPSTLAMNSWGYNTDASNNFVGLSTTDTLLKSVTGPASAGDSTAITYGIKLDDSKEAGNYTSAIVYTAAPQTD